MDRTKPDASNTSDDATQSQPVAHDTQAGTGPPPGLVAHPQALGGYRIVRLLGQGGMGAVYHARDDQLDRDLAIKTMKPEVAAQPGAVERFLREARVAAKVEHDNVIPILHVGMDRAAAGSAGRTGSSADSGTPYIAMPLLKGLPLDKWLRGDAVAPLGVVLKVGRETADGLAAAHERGLVHRDIKPANIWIEGDPKATDLNLQFRRVKILDFGLARPTTDDTHLTNSGVVVGTPAYMSPEQGRALPVDFRTDLWSLGVVLYRMTTGGMPFRGASTMAVLMSLGIDTPPAPAELNRDVPPALSDLIMRLLSKDREGRPASAAHVAAELRAIGRQAAEAARRATDAALSQSAPVPVYGPLAVGPESNPFADIDAPAPTESGVEGDDERTELAAHPPTAPKRGRGVWFAAGLAVLLAVGAVVAAVVFSGKKPAPTPAVPETTKDEAPKPQPGAAKPQQPPKGDLDRKAAEWVLGIGGRVGVADAAGERWLVAPAPLPHGPLTLTGIDCQKAESVRDADLVVFRGCADLTYFRLHGGQVTASGLDNLAGATKLTGLYLRVPTLTDDAVGRLSGFTGVTELTLAGSPSVSDAALEHLRGMTNLTRLQLGTTRVSGTGFRHLKGCTKLTLLSLYDTPTGDAGLEHLAGFTALTVLELDFCRNVTDAGLKRLAGLSNLTTLGLHDTQTTDAGLEHLTNLKNLTELTLTGTKVTTDAAKKLAQALPGCKITSDHGVIGPAGPGDDRKAAEWALGAGGYVLVRNAGGERHVSKRDQLPDGPVVMTQVGLAGRPITDDGLANLKGAAALTSVHLNGTKVTDAGLPHLAAAKGLQKLHLTGASGVTDAGLEHLKGFPDLVHLDLGGTKVTGAGLAKLGGAKKLAHLSVEGCMAFGDADLASAAAFPQLRWLHLRLTAVSDDGLKHLAKSTELTELYLIDTRVKGPGLAHLKELPKLLLLDASGSEFTDAGAEHLAAMRVLTDLNLSNTRVTAAGLERLRGHRALDRVALSNTKLTDAAAAHLAAIPRLRNLVLSKSGLTDAGVKHLAAAKGLTHLYLDDVPATDAGLEHLVGLADLEVLSIKGTKATADVVRKLQAALPKCKIASDHDGVPKK